MTFEDPIAAAEKMAPDAVTTHFKDYAVHLTNYGFKVSGVALGKSAINFRTILKKQTARGRIVLEILVEADNDETKTRVKEDTLVSGRVACSPEVVKIAWGLSMIFKELPDLIENLAQLSLYDS